MLGTLLSGATFGFLGSIFKGIMGFFENRSKRQHELSLLEKQKELIMAEAQANVTITKAQVEGAVELAETEAFKTSQLTGHSDIIKESWINNLLQSDAGWFKRAIGSLLVVAMAFTDVIRRLMRPVLTAYVMVGATWVSWLVWQILTYHATNKGIDGYTIVSFHAVLTREQAMAIFLQVIDFTFFMASSGFGWWFGDRAVTKGLFKKYGDNS